MRSLCQSLMQYIELLQIKYKLLKCIYINLPLIWIWFKPVLKKSHWSVQYGIKLMCDHVPHTDTHSHKPFWCNIIFPQQAYTIFALVHIWVPPHVFVCYRLSPFFFISFSDAFHEPWIHVHILRVKESVFVCLIPLRGDTGSMCVRACKHPGV